MLSVEKIFTAMGFAPVLTVDPQDLTAMKETVDRAVAALVPGEHPPSSPGGPACSSSGIGSKRECAMWSRISAAAAAAA